MKKIFLLSLFMMTASVSFLSYAVPKISCTYKWVNGEVRAVKCCDTSGCINL